MGTQKPREVNNLAGKWWKQAGSRASLSTMTPQWLGHEGPAAISWLSIEAGDAIISLSCIYVSGFQNPEMGFNILSNQHLLSICPC